VNDFPQDSEIDINKKKRPVLLRQIKSHRGRNQEEREKKDEGK